MREIREVGDEPAMDDRASAPVTKSDAVTHHGFNLHASVTVAADDDVGRERLARYGLRPPFSVARLSFQRDGMLAYRIKTAGRGRAKVRIMTPVEAMARLVALIPPPRFPLTRFHGVLAPRHKLRSRIVPRPPSTLPVTCPESQEATSSSPFARELGAADEPPIDARKFSTSTPKDAHTVAVATGGIALAANVLSVKHIERIRGGLLYAASANVNWALLLRRTFQVDVEQCVRCGGKVRVRAVITTPETAARILDALDKTRPRDPPSPLAA